MKILVHSNGPNIMTGYGVQTALLVDRLAGDNHDVAVSCTYGNQQGVVVWTAPQTKRAIRLYPSGFTTPSADIIHAHADHYLGPQRDGWVIALLDMWSLNGHPTLHQYPLVAWTPVDHDPVPPGVVQFFTETRAVPVAMSRFGERALIEAGVADVRYVPLAVDTKMYQPTYEIDGRSSREFYSLPATAFVVGMVAMNKDPIDRKGFQEGFLAFAEFQREHPEAILHIHSEQTGITGGLNLERLALAAGVRKGSFQFTDQYAYRLGLSPKHMAALYTCFDVLLAPSAGEGFCVPMVEAQACGVPVIASDFTAQPELVGAGWTVGGQRFWDEASRSWYSRANVAEVVGALEQAYAALNDDAEGVATSARRFALSYDADYIFETYWRPFLAELDGSALLVDKPAMDEVAVLCPVMKRPQNVAPLVESFNQHNDGSARLYFVVDPDDDEEIAAIKDVGATYLISGRGTSFACKLNSGFEQTTEDWVLVIGDDVEFTAGWLDAARQLSTRYDVIGTNDANVGEVRNARVANGVHADHYFVRRSYVDEEGATLDGPGLLAAEAYYHYFTDVETIQLAKALGKFTPCLDCRVIHHQPRYEGRPEDWDADPIYVRGGRHAERDETKFRQRAALIEARKTVKANIW